MFICLCIIYGCYKTKTVEFSSSKKDHISHKAYYLTFTKKVCWPLIQKTEMT